MSITHPDSFWKAGDEAAQFRLAHHMRHAAYDQAIALAGVALPTEDLTSKLSRDWLLRHDSRHAMLRVYIGAAGASGTAGLSSVDFASLDQIRAWMQIHATLHNDLDQYFGITGP
jgi:hypothetical protein